MAILKIKDETGKFIDIPAIQGAPGKDGAIQYEAGEGIKIDGNVISANVDAVPIYTFRSTRGYFTNNGDSLTADDLKALTTIINDAYQKNVEYLILNFGYSSSKSILLNFDYNLQDKPDYLKAVVISGSSNRYMTSSLFSVYSWQLSIRLSWENDICTVTSGTGYYSPVSVLSTTNGASFVPTSDYHPSTKKYVDDSIAAAITTTLEGEY